MSKSIEDGSPRKIITEKVLNAEAVTIKLLNGDIITGKVCKIPKGKSYYFVCDKVKFRKKDVEYLYIRKIELMDLKVTPKLRFTHELKVVECQSNRHVKSCSECCRNDYCLGNTTEPFAFKEIDLWLGVKRT